MRHYSLLWLASEMPILFSSDNGRPGATLSRSLSQVSLQYVLVFRKHWTFYASRQFASQAFKFSVNETGTTHSHHAVRCQQWLLALSSGILVPRGLAAFGQHQKERGRWGRECIYGREIVFVLRMLFRGKVAFGRWRSMHFVTFAHQSITFESIIL